MDDEIKKATCLFGVYHNKHTQCQSASITHNLPLPLPLPLHHHTKVKVYWLVIDPYQGFSTRALL